MILRPLQRGVAEDQIPFTCQLGLISLFKVQVLGLNKAAALFQHLRGGVKPGHIAVWQGIRELTRQFAGAASQVNDFEIRTHFHERQQIKKWRRTLRLKFMILVWIPGHGYNSPSDPIEIMQGLKRPFPVLGKGY